jgi:hypothetical protein
VDRWYGLSTAMATREKMSAVPQEIVKLQRTPVDETSMRQTTKGTGIRVTRLGEAATVCVCREFVQSAVDAAGLALMDLRADTPSSLVIDARTTTSIDMAGVAALVITASAVRRAGGRVETAASNAARAQIEACGAGVPLGVLPRQRVCAPRPRAAVSGLMALTAS